MHFSNLILFRIKRIDAFTCYQSCCWVYAYTGNGQNRCFGLLFLLFSTPLSTLGPLLHTPLATLTTLFNGFRPTETSLYKGFGSTERPHCTKVLDQKRPHCSKVLDQQRPHRSKVFDQQRPHWHLSLHVSLVLKDSCVTSRCNLSRQPSSLRLWATTPDIRMPPGPLAT